MGNFVRDALFEKEIIIKSDGLDIRSYQDVSDTVDWLAFLINNDFQYKTINVGSDNAISILNLAKKIKKVLKSEAEIKIKNNIFPDDNSRRRNYVPNLKRAYEIGLSQKVNLEDSIIKLSSRINNIKN